MDKRFLIIGGLFVVIIIVVIIAVAANSSRGVPSADLLGARLNGLSTLIKYGENSDITDSAVKQMVAEVSLVQTSNKNQLSKVFGSDKNFATPSEQAKAQESVTKLTSSLDEEKKTGSINSSYKDLLAIKIESVIELLNKTADGLSDKTTVSKVVSNYRAILERY